VSHAGLREISGWLLEQNTDIHTQGRGYGNALQVASYGSHEAVVWLLLEKNIHTQSGEYSNTLQVVLYGGHEALVQVLVEKNTEIHTQGGHFGNAFLVMSACSHDGVKGLLQEESQHQCAGRAEQCAPCSTKL